MTTAMSEPKPTLNTPRARHYAAMRLAITGDLRFLSHHDELRLLNRALLRADWPLAWSEGFNPIPRITAPLPRGLGSASLDDLFVVELSEPWPARRLFETLAPTLPDDCRLLRIEAGVAGKGYAAHAVTYTIRLIEPPSDLADRIGAFLSAREVITQRDFGPDKPRRPIDIRGYVEELEETTDGLRLTATFDGQRSVRPNEILEALGLAPHDAAATRERIQWTKEPAGLDVWPPTERTQS